MFDEILTKIFGSRNDRLIKQYRRKCEAINKLEPAMKALSDEALQAKTQEFRERIAKGETTDDLLPEAFAVVREAAVRVLGMRHYDVQLIGGMVLNDGKIAEMRTGEGKTLTATLAPDFFMFWAEFSRRTPVLQGIRLMKDLSIFVGRKARQG